MAGIKVLQIGGNNWAESMQIPKNTDWEYTVSESLADFLAKNYFKRKQGKKTVKIKKQFNCVLLLEIPKNLAEITEYTQNYAIIYDKDLSLDKTTKQFLKNVMAWEVDVNQKEELLKKINFAFFRGQTGIRMDVSKIEVYPSYQGEIKYIGTSKMQLDVCSDKFKPLATRTINMYVDANRVMKFWTEYEKDEGVELKYVITEDAHSVWSLNRKRFILTEEDLKKQYEMENLSPGAFLDVTVFAKGKGKVTLGISHSRWGRYEFGDYVLGGKIITSKNREEVAYYFDPGNLKPPLNVYFSAFRPREGLEAYRIIKALKHPFILISDPRLEGGSFYRGNDEYEGNVKNIIQEKLDELGFSKKDVIMSGMSMGSFGALYYGAMLEPKAIIVGKPLTNMGDIAANLQKIRPNEFDTSLDMLKNLTGDDTQKNILQLNQHFWKVFDRANFNETTFAISYMKEDDYDRKGYKNLITHLSNMKSKAKIIAKGFTGRHNDNSDGVIIWFIHQYQQILEEFDD